MRQFTSQFDASGQIRREAQLAGCSSMTLISQCTGVLAKALADADKSGGLCRSMSIRWIQGRKRGQNFLTRLLLPGQEVNTQLVQEMAREYDQVPLQSIEGEVDYIRAELSKSGVGCTGSQIELLSSKKAFSVGSWFTMDDQCGPGKLRSVNTFGGYPHAMAMDLRGQFAIFFDPNWGQFTFPSHLQMVNFLTKSMFTRQGTEHRYADRVPFNGVAKIAFQ